MGCSGHKTPTREDPCPSALPCQQRETKNQEQTGEQSVNVITQRKWDPMPGAERILRQVVRADLVRRWHLEKTWRRW